MQTILIIGGAGFMGCNFSEYFLKKGYRIISYDIKESRIKNENLINIIGNSKESYKFKEIFEKYKIDIVIYTLTSFIVVDENESYQELISENFTPIIDLFEYMKKNNTEKFIYISSGGSIYGKTTEPAKENTPKLPISFYGWLKDVAESYIQYMGRINKNFKYLIFRPSNVYGKYQSLNMLIGVSLKNAYLGTEMNIFGNKAIKKDYIHIDDFSEIINILIKKEKWNEIYNVGSGKVTSIEEILKNAEKITGKKLNLKYKEVKTGDVSYSVLNIDKVKKITGKSKFINVYDGMNDMFNYIKKELNNKK